MVKQFLPQNGELKMSFGGRKADGAVRLIDAIELSCKNSYGNEC